MRGRTVFLGCALGSLTLVPAIDAQTDLREGVKVRVTSTGSQRVTGVIVSTTPDSLFMLAEGGGRLSVARSSIQNLQVSQGRSASAGAKKGALWGAGILGGLGVVLAIALATDGSDIGSPEVVATVFILEGAGIGAVIGALVKSEKWETVSFQPRVSVGQGGIRVAFTVR